MWKSYLRVSKMTKMRLLQSINYSRHLFEAGKNYDFKKLNDLNNLKQDGS
jgi:hypothetical protein